MTEYSSILNASLREYSLNIRYNPDLVFLIGVEGSEEKVNIVPDLAGPILFVWNEAKQIIVYYTKVTSEMVSGLREIVDAYSGLFDDSEHSFINDLLNSAMEHPEFLDKLLKVLVKIGEALFRWLVEISPIVGVTT